MNEIQTIKQDLKEANQQLQKIIDDFIKKHGSDFEISLSVDKIKQIGGNGTLIINL